MRTASSTTARTWCGLVVLLLPALLTSMDISVLFVAAPAITEALEPTSGQWLWAMDIYGFVMAGLLVTMGGLGDRFGRKRLLLAGAALFGTASAIVAYAPNAELLIVGRALLAIGGATLAPSTLALIRAVFTDERPRRIAVGTWTVAFSGGAVAGPIVGGLLLEQFWWGAVFLINVPVMALLLVAGPALLPESRDPAPGPFDLAGAALSLTAALATVYALKRVADDGPDLVAAAAALLALAAGAGFAAHARRTAHPLFDIGLLRRPPFAAAIGANTVVALATTGLGALAFTFLQLVHGLSALESALWALPTFAGTIAGSAACAALAGRSRPPVLLAAGLAIAATGLGVVAFGGPGASLTTFLVGYTVLTTGVGMTATAANSLVLTTAPPQRAGAASALSETSTEFGGALGIATFGTVASAVYTSGIADVASGRVPAHAADTVAATLTAAGGLDEPHRTLVREEALAAYTDGLTAAATTGLLVSALAAAGALTVHLRQREPVDATR
ncbi:DHA2 family multidrug resistance protein-like MFS transporter [Prauserella isguenensis]|uniref:DHA2 family multidrug resistance protein-like MFS transporter n=1 Tax=Prauserella isguenensis TaxID=1470180 RepID=A0A839S4I7_9PSEU|nr:MFS transporter [Prauserella isguenensis]MBB3053001.1 DHA2 family multidrug resistance protein-like MFS transporter [Prauserella isguenensis]